MINFPPLHEVTLAAVNRLGAWLAQNDFPPSGVPPQADIVILAGNAVIPTIDAACHLAAKLAVPLLISGGIGHSTAFLYSAVARHPRYGSLPTAGRTEAAILADIARQFWQIPGEQLLIEPHSSNCGENARFSRALLQARRIHPQRAIVVQDPTMQRRTIATFRRVTRDEQNVPRWLSFPGITPQLRNAENGVTFSAPQAGLWPISRYLSLVLGEIPRLRDDENGYGPRGRDFISHVAIPADVDAGWRTLQADTLLTEALHNRAPG